MRRPISRRAVGAGDEAELAAAIGGDQRHGVLMGVTVDFRHAELPVGDWEAAPWWHVWADSPDHAGLIFPLEAEFSLDQLREQKGGMDAPAIYIYAGDRLSIERVIPKFSDRRFDHLHDAQQRLAYLRIDRADGEVMSLPQPMTFYGKTRVLRHGTRQSFDHIADRICSHLGTEDLPSWGVGVERLPIWDRPLEEIAGRVAQDAKSAYWNLLPLLPEDGAPGAKLERAYLRTVINNAALAGFLLGKAEARRAEIVAAAAAKNLEKGPLARMNPRWREDAQRVWGANPDWTTHRVAKEIAADDDDLSAVQRAIKKLAPETSPSFKRN